MPYKVREVVKSLLKKGFEEVEGSRHRKFRLYHEGSRTSVATVMSHGETELREVLTGVVARQLSLTHRQFDDLVKCPLDHEGYIRLLRQKNVLESTKDQN